MPTFTFNRDGDTTNPLTIDFTVGGTATFLTDYTVSGATTFGATAGSVVIPSGQSSASIIVTPVADSVIESNESVILTVTDNPTVYNRLTTAPVVMTIQDDDTGPVLDSISTSVASAYSLRKLRAAYTGSAIRVRRGSDNAQQDIGFVGNDLDTASLSSFVGSGDGFIQTWYDQSGNNRNATQTSNGTQPRIVVAGVLHTRGSRPAIRQETTQWILVPSGLSVSGGSWTVNYCAGMIAGGSKGRVLTTGFSQQNWHFGFWGTRQQTAYFGGGTENSGISANDNMQVYTAIGAGASNALTYRNGVQYNTSTPSTPPAVNSSSLVATNGGYASGSSEPSLSSICELILYGTSLSSIDRAFLDNNQISFYGVV
jgi:trimeric autotransporter adhesin